MVQAAEVRRGRGVGPAPRALCVALGAGMSLPALAQTNASLLTCQIPVPDPARAGSYIAPDGSLVAAGTPGAFPPAAQPFGGEDVRRALQGGTLPGVDLDRSNAYLQYIRRLQSGTSGFTCFASLQMPRP